MQTHLASEYDNGYEPVFDRTPPRSHSQRPISRPIVSGILAATDGVVLLAAGAAAYGFAPPQGQFAGIVAGLATVLAAILAINLLHLQHAYRFEIAACFRCSVGRVLLAWGATVGVVAAFVLPVPGAMGVLDSWFGRWAASGVILLHLSRAVFRLLARRWEAAGRLRHKWALVGTGKVAHQFLKRLNGNAESEFEIVAVFDDLENHGRVWSMGYRIQPLTALPDQIRQRRVDGVVVAVPLTEQWRIAEIVRHFRGLAIDVRLCLDEIGPGLGAAGVSEVAGTALLNVSEPPLRDWGWIIKCTEDRVLATLMLILISPVLLLIALGIKLDSRGPALFRQKRYGFNNELIDVFKFRTMYHDVSDADCEQQTQRDDPRVTRIGWFLRRTSLDELPQFLNVLLGEMSLVGPRPHAIATKADGVYFEDAVRHYEKRHRIKPGITGWAQVNGWRGETQTLEQIRRRVEFDLYYIDNWSLWLDLVILLRTLRCGFLSRQAY
jgi:Undecaprenyl-phosphate glucose phosphotransferase